MGAATSAPPAISAEQQRAVLNHQCSVKGIVDYIKRNDPQNIVLMVGAGISVSAGIPDFRTPGSGLYDNLQKYKLESPQDIFTLSYFMENPQPFYDLARAMYPSQFKPTPTHLFIRLLQDKGILRRCYTQNIDTLERVAGVLPDLLVEAHGSFGEASCTSCGQPHTAAYFKSSIFEVPESTSDEGGADIITNQCICQEAGCGGLVKPNIVFFGENLPRRYFDLRESDLREADLLVVLGTSLSVAPFSETMHLCSPHAPRLLINREVVGAQRDLSWMSNDQGFKFDRFDNYRDVSFLGSCDDCVFQLCDMLGWRSDLLALLEAGGEVGGYTVPDMISPNDEQLHYEITRNQVRRLADHAITAEVVSQADYDIRKFSLASRKFDSVVDHCVACFTEQTFVVNITFCLTDSIISSMYVVAVCPDICEGNMDKALGRSVKGTAARIASSFRDRSIWSVELDVYGLLSPVATADDSDFSSARDVEVWVSFSDLYLEIRHRFKIENIPCVRYSASDGEDDISENGV